MLKHIENSKFLKKTSNFLINQIVGIMSLNWLFLFAVTYGKYGWDVGEPISYLTSLTVDLMIIAGFFNLNESLSISVHYEHMKIMYRVNSTVRYAQLRAILAANQRHLM